jgi:hypothetical protein
MLRVTINLPAPGASDVANREFHVKKNGADDPVQSLAGTSTSAQFDCDHGTSCEVWLIDVDAAGNRSPESNHLSFTAQDTFPPPGPRRAGRGQRRAAPVTTSRPGRAGPRRPAELKDRAMHVAPSDPIFDAGTAQTGPPHLLQYLWDRYTAHIGAALERRRKEGKPAAVLAFALRDAPATHFIKWAGDYLAENRAAETFFLDANLGLRLTNNDLVAVSPGVDVRGSMQDAGAVHVTTGRDRPDDTSIQV